MSATAPVRGPASLRRPGTLHVPAIDPIRAVALPKATTRPRLRLVLVSPHRTTAGRLPFVIVVGAVLVGGLLAVLMLHTLAAQDAFRITTVQQRLATLTDEEQQQAQVVAADSSPTALRARAEALGMVPTSLSKFHRHSDGRAVATQTPVYVAPPVTTTVKKTVKKTATAKSGTSPATGTKQSATAGKNQSPATGKKQSPAAPKKPKPGHSKP